MPRPRKNHSTALVEPIVEQFTRKLGETLERFITARVSKEIARTERDLSQRGGGGRGRRRRARVLCYYPGCKNLAAPRFGMFCAAQHKNLSKAEKEKYRALHAKQAGQAASAAPAARQKRAK
jgi:hypothetical protein